MIVDETLTKKYAERMMVYPTPKEAIEELELRRYERTAPHVWQNENGRAFLTRLKNGYLVTWGEFQPEAAYLYREVV
jgi:hypothetical protein